MADWSQLPPELLILIAERLEARFDVTTLHSTELYVENHSLLGHMWKKHSESRIHSDLSSELSLVDTNKKLSSLSSAKLAPATSSSFEESMSHITRNTFYLLRSSRDFELEPRPRNFPKVLDLSKFQQYIGLYDVYIDHPLEPLCYDYRKKVVLQQSSTNCDDFIIFASFRYPAFLRSGEKEWTVLEIMYDIEDIISFNGKFYAIDLNGKTRVIDQSLNVSFLPFEMLWNPEKGIGFGVFRLSEEEQRWDKMESLGEQILFLDSDHAISALASEFCCGKGNLIFYPENPSSCPEYSHIFLFDLETVTTSPLENCPAYCNLFCHLF
ncbi:hypothetical protein ERO13_D01G162580v2 [Gossypium hirsutum]|nr:hypothetical protein ERO13_D01G162580v2 [Gossypium hirsutum]